MYVLCKSLVMIFYNHFQISLNVIAYFFFFWYMWGGWKGGTLITLKIYVFTLHCGTNFSARGRNERKVTHLVQYCMCLLLSCATKTQNPIFILSKMSYMVSLAHFACLDIAQGAAFLPLIQISHSRGKARRLQFYSLTLTETACFLVILQ